MNYLKKYRKDAGLISSNENMHRFTGADGTVTPTKETLDYLAGAIKQQKTPVPVLAYHGSFQAMKTPVRKQSPCRKTPSAAKEGRKSAVRTSGIMPFNRVDQNLNQSSSRKSIKQVSSQSKKQQQHDIYGGVINSFRNNAGTSPFAPNTDNKRPGTGHAASKTSQVRKVPTRQSISGTKTPNQHRISVKKTASSQSIFAQGPKNGYSLPQGEPTMMQQHDITTPKNQSIIFREEVTPNAIKKSLDQSKTPNDKTNYGSNQGYHSRKKSGTQQSHQRNRKKRGGDSPVSETASEKAVKDAMMKTTQKIYFPKAFHMPGQKSFKQEKQTSSITPEQQRHSTVISPVKQAKRAVVNLESENSGLELQPQVLPQPTKQFDIRSPVRNHPVAQCERTASQMLAYQEHPQMLDERSFTSLENLAETYTEKSANFSISRNSCGRRSRKDRSKGNNSRTAGRNAITPHVICDLKPAIEQAPNVRMMPGSDAISLELNILGMTEPNKNFEVNDESQEDMTQASSQQPQNPPRQTLHGSFRNAASSMAHTRSSYKPQTVSSNGELKGSLNAFVQHTSVRSRTPLINHDAYGPNQSISKTGNGQDMPSSCLADKIMRPVQLTGMHKKTPSTMQTNQTMTSVTPTKLPQQTALSKSAMRQRGNSFIGARDSNNNLTPLRQRGAEGDLTPTRLAIERSRFSNVTTPIDRSSESLEKINEVFRQISVGTFDALSLIRKPAKSDLDGCYIFCRFVNAFRPAAEQWDAISMQQWQTMMSLLLHSPSCQKICLEIQQIKKKVLRPHISRVSQTTYDVLAHLRDTYMSHLNERTLNVQYKHSQVVRKLVNLVFVSINHLIPLEKDQEEEPSAVAEPNDKLQEQEICQEVPQAEAVQDQEDLTPHRQESSPDKVESGAHPDWMEDEVATGGAIMPASHSPRNSGSQSHRESQHQEKDETVAPHSIPEMVHEAATAIMAKQESNDTAQHNKSRQGEALANRYAEQEEDFEQERMITGDDEVESSKGSAWPSETSRLTPLQSAYQVAMVPQAIPVQVHQSHDQMQTLMSQQKPKKEAVEKKEEPMTEMKRVPYRIMDRDEAGMFEDFSCSSIVDRPQQIGAGLLPMPQNQDMCVLDIVKMATAQQTSVNSTLTKHERIAQLQAAQELIQKQITDLLQMESARGETSPAKDEESKGTIMVAPLNDYSSAEKRQDDSGEMSSLSPMRFGQAFMESPQKLSAIKASLAIKQETVEKELDSILGDSPSPSKQIMREGWNLNSPEKFAFGASPDQKFSLKLDRVAAIPEDSPCSDADMSSHDLTQEEEEAKQQRALAAFAEVDAEGALASQRDRQTNFGLENAALEGDQTCSEIRLSFFSPTKLQEYFVKKPANEAVERFHNAIEKHERELKSAQQMNIRQKLDERLKDRIASRQSDEAGMDSPSTRDRKYKQMQNDIFNKIQAQLQNM